MRSVALLSSGLDSSVALAMARERGQEIAFALTFDYGQRAAAREIKAARAIADYFGISHRTLALPWFSELKRGGGLLSKVSELPKPSVSELSERDFSEQSARAVWVPNRNGVLLEIAAALAEDEGAKALLVGFNAEEAETFPDNSEAYREAITAALFYSTANHVEVLAPTERLTKPQIIREGVRLGFPFSLLWSCYEAGEKMCGCCESCMRLKRALRENEVKLEGSFADPSLSR